ncbi:Flap endonuclease GEN-like protein 1-like [Oopsacas minuta]|uniref:Flap endonuclease GEN-like protein 1-like n=1 Tax=Oopsacas minuta TaxID=111878 RepID=A0AAV7JQ54_9METZ|nr:Flap endonuclease GEN-like protein 1-like [Oopsacas minuta]
MGVHQLWQLLAPAGDKVSLSSLKGQTIAIDLSSWIVESIQAFKRPNIPKPHLRNLFFRCIHLTRLGIKLVFVCDGDAPSLKKSALNKRYGRAAAKLPRSRNKKEETTGVRRSLLRVHTNECMELLEYLGIPYVQAVGEAEALCALMNREKYVDAVLTEDSDAFLYGATVVLRGLNIGDPDINMYSMEKISKVLKIGREDMIAMGVLLGCDFYTGVATIGKASCLKLCQKLKTDVTLLDRMEAWVANGFDSSKCEFPYERSVNEKLLAAEQFSFESIKGEFLQTKDEINNFFHIWSCPDIKKLEVFLEYNLDWPVGYTCEKSRCMVTGWFISHLKSHPSKPSLLDLSPNRIVKNRKRQNDLYYEVEWKGSGYILGEIHNESLFTTIEPSVIINSVFPGIVEEFEQRKKPRKTKKRAKCANSKPVEESDEIPISLTEENLEISHIDDVPCNELDTYELHSPPDKSPELPLCGFSRYKDEFTNNSHLEFNDSSIIFVQDTPEIRKTKQSLFITDEYDIFLQEKFSTSLTMNDSDILIQENITDDKCENSLLLESANNCSFELALPLYERLKMNSK